MIITVRCKLLAQLLEYRRKITLSVLCSNGQVTMHHLMPHQSPCIASRNERNPYLSSFLYTQFCWKRRTTQRVLSYLQYFYQNMGKRRNIFSFDQALLRINSANKNIKLQNFASSLLSIIIDTYIIRLMQNSIRYIGNKNK